MSGPVTVVEVDGLVDPVLADFVDDRSARPRTSAPSRSCSSSTAAAAVGDGELDELVAGDRGLARAGRGLDRAVGQPGRRRRGPAGGAGRNRWHRPGVERRDHTWLCSTPAASTPADLGTADVGDRVGAARAVEIGLVDTDAPIIGEFVVGLDGVETRGGGRRPAAGDPGPVQRARHRRPADAHGGQPRGGVPAVRDRAGAAALRAVHRRGRRGRGGGRRLADPRLLRPGRAAHPADWAWR